MSQGSCHTEHTVSGTLVALSHSIRLRLRAHTGAECVLRATYQRRGNSREVGKGEKGQIEWQTETEMEKEGVRGGERNKKKSKEAEVV